MTIKIKNLTFKTIIGVLKFERLKKQKVIINLKAKYIYKNNNYINYVELNQLIKNRLQQKKFELLEDAINDIISQIVTKYPTIKKLKLEITKPDILKDCQVSISKKWGVKKN